MVIVIGIGVVGDNGGDNGGWWLVVVAVAVVDDKDPRTKKYSHFCYHYLDIF